MARKKLLSTRVVGNEIADEISAYGVDLLQVDFIETIALIDNAVTATILAVAAIYQANVIFSSVNAVTAVSAQAVAAPRWKIYCVGEKTALQAKEVFPASDIVRVENSAGVLAEKIISHEDKNRYFFFCGDKRRDELPEALAAKRIDLQEFKVYSTRLISVKINEHFDAVAFFSPTAAEAFFKENTVGPECGMFAIGETTASEIKKYCANPVLLPAQPGKKDLLLQAAAWLEH